MYGVLTERLGPLCRVPREVEAAEKGPIMVNRNVRPSPRSFHETTLNKGTWRLPTINRLDHVQNSLQKDKFRHAALYNDSAQPTGGSSRFYVELPRTPQHTKYCTKSSELHEQEPESPKSTTSSKKSPKSVSGERSGNGAFETKFSIRTLREMFLQFGGGAEKITHRRLIIMLQNKSDFMDKLMQFSEENWQQDESNMPQKLIDDDSHTGHVRRQIYNFKQVLKELDEDGNGQMEWEEFVEFFRRCGLLLEYQSDAHLNHTSLDVLSLELTAKRASQAGSKDSARNSDAN